jgi:hypothetical protein
MLNLEDIMKKPVELFKSEGWLSSIVMTRDERLSIVCNGKNEVIVVDN